MGWETDGIFGWGPGKGKERRKETMRRRNNVEAGYGMGKDGMGWDLGGGPPSALVRGRGRGRLVSAGTYIGY